MMRRWFSPGSLRTQLVWLFVVFALAPLLLSNVVGYVHARRNFVEQATLSVSQVAALKAAELMAFVQLKRDILPTIVAGNAHLVAAMRAAQDGSREALVQHLELKARESGAEQFMALSTTGETLGQTPTSDDEVAESCFRAAVGGAAAHELRLDLVEPSLFAAAPVAGEEGAPLGMLCARFGDLRQQLGLTLPPELPGATLWLLDGRGRVVIDGAAEGLDIEPLVEVPGAKGTAPWRGRYRMPSGESALAAAAPVRELGATIFVAFPTATALASVDRLMLQAIVSMGVLALLIVVTVRLTARRLTRSLATLRDAAVRIAGGAPSEPVPISGPDEIVELGRAFEVMSRAVRESHEHLEQRIAERTQALEHSRAFAELLIDASEQSIVVISRNGEVRAANRVARRLFGEEIVGRRYAEICIGCSEGCTGGCTAGGMLGDTHGGCACDVRRAFTTGERVTRERSQRVGEVQEILRTESMVISGEAGPNDAVLQLGRIVTSERHLQARLIHQEKMAAFGLLAAGIAHDIGNPLAALQSQLRVAHASSDRQVISTTLSIAEEQVARMSRLLRELVSLTRRRPDTPVLVSVNQVVSDVVRLLKHDPRARSVAITDEIGAAVHGVRAKEDHLWQVLLNLGINSLDAMPEGGSLTFATANEGAQVVIRVHDTGAGIPPEARGRLFEPFFTTKAHGKGTGLGLFVSKGVIEGLGGALVLESSPGQGTIFAVKLPAATRGAAGAGPT